MKNYEKNWKLSSFAANGDFSCKKLKKKFKKNYPQKK